MRSKLLLPNPLVGVVATVFFYTKELCNNKYYVETHSRITNTKQLKTFFILKTMVLLLILFFRSYSSLASINVDVGLVFMNIE